MKLTIYFRYRAKMKLTIYQFILDIGQKFRDINEQEAV